MHKAVHTIVFLTSLFGGSQGHASQPPELTVAPPSWWVGMQSSTLQLMVAGKDIAGSEVTVNSPDVSIVKVASQDSPNYLFIDVDVKHATARQYTFTLRRPGQADTQFTYDIHRRRDGSRARTGFGQRDTIYLVTADRFVNGDPSNDAHAALVDKPQPDKPGGRHGGDIQGLIDHLDYLQEMGFTQLWPMPLLENAMDAYSYHGYAITDHYQIDPRYGTNALYRELSKQGRERGIGLIMDVVLNHIGSHHPWMADMPSADWINNQGEFTATTHRREALHDMHGVAADVSAFSDGWFVPTMPDLNQQNPYLATYLTQQAIWWIEYADLSGLRVDTYSYSDKAFLSHWTQRLMQEYPELNIVGEEWTVNPVITSYWQAGSNPDDGYQSSLPSVMDFPLQATLVDALKNQESWGTGLVELYSLLASDALYGDPYNLVIFGDNHDMSRIFTQLDEDFALWKMAMTYLLTSRGIPQVFYGTEILMANPHSDDHGVIRSNFPGSWPDDKVNGFTGENLTAQQQEARALIQGLLTLRRQHPVIATGQYTHYAPQEGVYVYFKTAKEGKQGHGDGAMVVLNKNAQQVTLPLPRFAAQLQGINTLQRWPDSSEVATATGEITIAPQSATVWLLN